MIKKIKKEDYEKVVKLFKERNPEYTVEIEFIDYLYFCEGPVIKINEENKIIMLKLRFKKEDFLEQKPEKDIFKELYTILEEMDFKNFRIGFNTERTECLIFQMKSD